MTKQLTERCLQLKERGVVPTLAILRVGENGADISYENAALKRCAKIGIEVRHFLLPTEADKSRVLETIKKINRDDTIHGCLMFRPLPDKEAEREAGAVLAPEKDVDCMTADSLIGVFTGNQVGYPPCTAQACLEILDHYRIPIEGKHAVVIGRSLVIGKPVSMMLQRRNATVTMCHTKTTDMPALCRQADILIAAAGAAGMVDASYLSPGQVVIDVGINVDASGKLCGDVNFSEAEPVVAALTPVPGGVGNVTTSVLAKHVIEAAECAAR
jgi:methylenetetrahydrofolate dehydrogenase (NADP+)/methenyltetrahydrofolate cyclohydrolase